MHGLSSRRPRRDCCPTRIKSLVSTQHGRSDKDWIALPVFLTGAMPALGLLALPTLWASSSIRGVDHPSVARLVKDWAQSTWLTKGLYEMLVMAHAFSTPATPRPPTPVSRAGSHCRC